MRPFVASCPKRWSRPLSCSNSRATGATSNRSKAAERALSPRQVLSRWLNWQAKPTSSSSNSGITPGCSNVLPAALSGDAHGLLVAYFGCQQTANPTWADGRGDALRLHDEGFARHFLVGPAFRDGTK